VAIIIVVEEETVVIETDLEASVSSAVRIVSYSSTIRIIDTYE
jgi:hypothetical protein